MKTATIKRRVELQGFKLLELKRIDGHRFLVVEPAHGLVIRGHDEPLTIEQVEAFVRDCEENLWTADP